jgi:two-component system response regulator MprA
MKPLPTPAAPRQKAVLIAEDEPLTRVLLARLVKHLGFVPLVAINGVDAIANARNAGDGLAAAILDIAMPLLSGIDAARVIRTARPSLPIILVSASMPILQRHSVDLPTSVHCLPKPFPLTALEDLLQTLCGLPHGRYPFHVYEQ